jgi:cytohesin
MKHILITIAAVVLVGCGNPQADRALLEAAERGNIIDVKRHLAAGADVNATNRFESTPLHIAIDNGHKEIAELLIAKGLLSKGADVNAKDGWGETPLHWVETKEVAELLIAEGADVHAKDKWGFTPLREAAANGHKEIAELLIGKGADVNAKYEDGGTP